MIMRRESMWTMEIDNTIICKNLSTKMKETVIVYVKEIIGEGRWKDIYAFEQ